MKIELQVFFELVEFIEIDWDYCFSLFVFWFFERMDTEEPSVSILSKKLNLFFTSIFDVEGSED